MATRTQLFVSTLKIVFYAFPEICDVSITSRSDSTGILHI